MPTEIDRVEGVYQWVKKDVDEEEAKIGEYLREKGHEFGTTTGRPRRIGWLDLVMLKQAVQINGITGLAFTRLDTMAGLEFVKVATAYQYEKLGTKYDNFPSSMKDLARVIPVYHVMPGWREFTGSNVPENAMEYVRFVSRYLEVPVKLIGVGPERSQTI